MSKFVKMITAMAIVLSMTGCGISSTVKGIVPFGERHIIVNHDYDGRAIIDVYKINDDDYRIVEKVTKQGMEDMEEEDYITEMSVEIHVTREGIEDFLSYDDFGDIEL